MTLAAQDLSALPERQGDHLAAAVAHKIDLRTDRLGDEAIDVDGCDFDRPLVGALDEQLGAGGEDAQRKVGRKRIVAVIFLELRFGGRPLGHDRRGRADALGRQRAARLHPLLLDKPYTDDQGDLPDLAA